ncbi:MAG: M23 family metallopeptidase [Bacillota bacterium]|nr:M23 family metallopeptidase [Bacillota bacterium]
MSNQRRNTGYYWLVLALTTFAVISAAYLYLTGPGGDSGVTEPVRADTIVPYNSAREGSEVEPQIFFYPLSPAPGDFLIVEAGPLPQGEDFEIDFDFFGVLSDYYHVGNLLFAVIAVNWDINPGTYKVAVVPVQENATAKGAALAEGQVEIAAKEFKFSRFSMPADRTAGWTAARLAEDREKVRIARETTEPHPLWVQTFIPPLEGRISSEYAAIRVINNNPPRRHAGIDIAVDEGTPVIAPNRGIVRLAEFLLSGGNSVIIDHGMDLSSTYLHLHTINVEVGDIVERGDLIGTVGMTGYATGNHLHWEVNIGQTPVNPGQLMANELLWIPPAYQKDYLW